MRKTVLSSVVLAQFLLWAPHADACEITFAPAQASGKVGDVVTFTASIKWEHRKCVLDDNDVQIDVTGGRIESQSGWTKVRPGYFENQIKVKLQTQGDVTVNVHRRCDKKGTSQGILKIKAT